jgi:hypothetical protein
MLSCCSFCAFPRWLSSSAFKALSFFAPSRNSQEESRLLGLATASRRATLLSVNESIAQRARDIETYNCAWFARLNARTGTLTMTWSTGLTLARMTGDSYSLVDMQSGAVANNLAFVEYDLALINADHGPKLVVQELLPAMFDVFRETDPVAHRERDLLLLEHAKLNCRAWSSGNCLSTPSFPTMTTLSPQPLRERITGQLLRGANA